MSTAELSKECFPHYRSVLPVKWLGVIFCSLVVLALTSSSKAAAFAPYFYDAFITNRVDLDGDGFARQFDIAFDADSNISGSCYVKVYEYDGGFGFDDLLLTTISFAVSGTVTDYRLIRIVCSDYPGADLLNRGAAEIRIDLYNAANNTLIQSWTPGNDPDLGNIMVELTSEDSVPVLSIASITPSGMQTLARGQTVVYTIVVRDTNGSPVSGATVFGTNHLEGRTFTTSPATTDGNGQLTYTTTVPICHANGIFDVSFSASKPGWVTSQPAIRQVQVNQPANRAPVASAAQIRGQPPVLRIGEVCSISADYTDPDGADDLRFCLLRVGHPSTPLAFAYDTLTGTVQPITTNLQTFISPVTVERTTINNGVRLTWHFFLKRTWRLVDSQIDFSVGALDRCGLEDGWNSDGRSLAFQNPTYGCTFIIHGFQLFSGVPDWVETMGGRIAERLGNGEVYEYDPASTSFIRHPQLSVGTNSAFEKVFLFNWSDESDNLATGYAEAAADAFFAAIIRAQQAVPTDPFLNRIHLIGHSRGCVVGSELIERLHAFSTQGEDINLFHYPIDTRIDVTFLDPHTTGTTLTGDFGDPEVNSLYLPERGVVVWSNVGHANNYYQTQNDNSFFYLNGEFVPGSRNRNLDSPVLVGIDHSEVHAWYFGTIDPEATQDELAAMILEEQANTEAAAFFSQPFQVNAYSPQAPMMESVMIQRPQWYLDNVGVTEGYAHTRRGGEIAHNESREPLDATPAQDSFHDLIIDGIFNGNFKHGAGEVVDMPGWDRHSGGGEGVLDAGHLRLEDPLISPNARYRRHNLLFVPSTAKKLGFRLRVYQSDTRTIPNADRLVVKLGTNTIGGQPGREIWLTQSSTAFKNVILEVPASLRGTANTLTLEIVPGGGSVSAKVWIDDLNWLDDSYMNVSLARLPGGETEITMRGKILNRYVIEASPDLMAWTQLALLTNTTGTIRYTDTAATSQQRRFYRALSVP